MDGQKKSKNDASKHFPKLESWSGDTCTVLIDKFRYTYAIDLAEKDFIDQMFKNAPWTALNYLKSKARWFEKEEL